jgi:AcrR family transcriptional regulator
MDARQQRTRAQLARAILELAEAKSVTSITVSELAAVAKINRSTFYEHSDSPASLLRSTLRDELDVIRDRNLGAPLDVRTAVLQVTTDVLDHVDAHSTIYSRGLSLDDNAGELHSMLSAHFAQSMRQLFESGTVELPKSADPAYLEDTAARFIADGTVGAIEAWLRTPAPRERQAFLEAYRLVMPGWWPLVV